MQNADPKVVQQLNELVNRYADIEAEEIAEDKRHKIELERHHAKQASFAEWREELGREIWEFIAQHATELMAPRRKSFTTSIGTFEFRTVPAAIKILDSKSIMEIARSLGVVRQIAKPPAAVWRFNQVKFLKWLKQNGELREHFADYFVERPKSETLIIKLGSLSTFYDERISKLPTISIRKPS